ncbi:MAG: type II toxin-antitoxin system VapB family antitoxin [Bifidobacteriaceae bacterium]|nr:type II toxin-antitoxin system VapB family antitoxin [Bifidobacteriaceae bacterium]
MSALRAHLRRGGLLDAAVGDAVLMRLVAAIEALSRLPEGLRAEATGGRWREIWATRNVVVRGYEVVDADTIAETVDHDLPVLEDGIGRLAERLSRQPAAHRPRNLSEAQPRRQAPGAHAAPGAMCGRPGASWRPGARCRVGSKIHIGGAMRTNIDIDDDLMAGAMAAAGTATKRETVNLGLRELIRQRSRVSIQELRGRVEFWPGFEVRAADIEDDHEPW